VTLKSTQEEAGKEKRGLYFRSVSDVKLGYSPNRQIDTVCARPQTQ